MDDGGAEIFNYVIEYRIEGAYKWVRATEETVPDLTYVVKRLSEGAMYEFRFAAENKAGVGPMSEPTAPVEAKEPLGNSCCYDTECKEGTFMSVFLNFVVVDMNRSLL